jgi:hypothetical protein
MKILLSNCVIPNPDIHQDKFISSHKECHAEFISASTLDPKWIPK